jgi:hypothetical protein
MARCQHSRDSLTAIEHVLLPISSGRRKYELAVRPPGVLLEFADEFRRRWDLALLAALGIEPEFRLGGYRTAMLPTADPVVILLEPRWGQCTSRLLGRVFPLEATPDSLSGGPLR